MVPSKKITDKEKLLSKLNMAAGKGKIIRKNKKKSIENKKDLAPIKKGDLEKMARKYSKKALRRIADFIDDKNPNVALKASKIILDKSLPDLKSVEGKQEVDVMQQVMVFLPKRKELVIDVSEVEKLNE